MTRAAVGLQAHTGWATAVTLAGSPSSPAVSDRRRLDLEDSVLPRQIFHAARSLEPHEAEDLVRRGREAAESIAQRAVGGLVDELHAMGLEVVGSGILLARGRPGETVAQALSSHVAMHTAEGDLFRQALVRAAERCGLEVSAVQRTDVFKRLAPVLRIGVDEVRAQVNELGRTVGSPWGQDQKNAAAVAWLALAEAQAVV